MTGREYIWMTATAVAYLLGIGTGILFSKNWMEQKYKKVAEEEIESVKDVFKKRMDAQADAKPVEPPTEENPDAKEYRGILHENGYSDERQDSPYVITPEEFGEIDGYDQISLTFFADGVLTDDNYQPITDLDNMIGDALEHFGEYEDDSVYVRNPHLECDFEILRDIRRYSDVCRTMPSG